jgi:hypothetical protein
VSPISDVNVGSSVMCRPFYAGCAWFTVSLLCPSIIWDIDQEPFTHLLTVISVLIKVLRKAVLHVSAVQYAFCGRLFHPVCLMRIFIIFRVSEW